MPGTYVEQIPVLQPAETIEQMAQIVKAYALERWKAAEGWYGHQAAAMTVTQAFYQAAADALAAGITNPNAADNEQRTFNLNEI